jgi:hypothetical protein
MVRYLIFTMSVVKNGSHEENTCKIPWEKIKYKHDKKEDEGKTLDLLKVKHPNLLIILFPIVLLE